MIPKELKERKQWICWKYQTKPGRSKPTKIPYNPATGMPASTMDASTWVDFETARQKAGQYSGIGFVFTKEDPYVGIDLDHVLDKDGKFIQQDAKNIFDYCKSYTEISPSGTGIHIIGKAKLSPNSPHKVEENKERGTCEKEMYEAGRYFTVTGNQLGNVNEISDIEDMAAAIEQMIYSEQQVHASNRVPKIEESEKSKQEAVHTAQEYTPRGNDPMVDFVKETFPELGMISDQDKVHRALEKMTSRVSTFLKETNIKKVTQNKDLFITYSRNGRNQTLVIPEEGSGFQIPQDPREQKKYLYEKLIRGIHKEGLWDMSKMPQLEDMHKVTQILTAHMSEIPCESGFKETFTRQELEKAVGEPTDKIWMELMADMGRAPNFAKAITFYTQGDGEKGLSVSKSIVGMFTSGKELKLEEMHTMTHNEEQVQEGNFRPEMKDAIISSTVQANFKWFSDRGLACYMMKSEEMSGKIFSNCSFNDLTIVEPIKNTTFKDCCFDGVSLEGSAQMGQIEIERCRIGSQEDLDTLTKAGAVIKDSQVYRMDQAVGKKNWQLIGLEKPKLIENRKVLHKTEKEGLER